ncbi:MAG: hypothetical protein EA352_11560 [Gemmatimonadales bacterium]|nr:MAG: hypothetical protein EA352_11560 [Gemmatimonadales bacterium]
MTPGSRAPRAAPCVVFFLLLFVGGWLPGPAGAQDAPAAGAAVGAALPAEVQAVLDRPELAGAQVGLLLAEMPAGPGQPLEVILERGADLRFVPASNHKIVVAAAALEALGPGYRFRTELLAPLPPGADGRIRGDLVLMSGGDPTLGEPFWTSAEGALEALADSAARAGLRRVDGVLRVDATSWDSTTVPTGWLVGNLDRRYAATGGAFSVAMGELELEVSGGARPGDPAEVRWRPMGTADFVENLAITGQPGEATDLQVGYLPESRRWRVEGRIAPEARDQRLLAQRDPVRQAAHALLRALESRGIVVTGGVEVDWPAARSGATAGPAPGAAVGAAAAGRPPGLVRIAALESPSLPVVVEPILARSQNWMTEQLVRVMGAELGREGNWDEGFRIVEETLVARAGLAARDLHFRDGSGLAGYNLVTPRALARILAWARFQPWGTEFQSGLAAPGMPESTLEARLGGLEGRVQAKTGTISHVNALSGYLVDDAGRERVFVLLTNAANHDAAPIRRALDDLVRIFASSP